VWRRITARELSCCHSADGRLWQTGQGGAWAISYYLDVGTGSSKLTWQAMAGIEYRFHWGNAQLSYRYLYYNMREDQLLQGSALADLGSA